MQFSPCIQGNRSSTTHRQTKYTRTRAYTQRHIYTTSLLCTMHFTMVAIFCCSVSIKPDLCEVLLLHPRHITGNTHAHAQVHTLLLYFVHSRLPSYPLTDKAVTWGLYYPSPIQVRCTNNTFLVSC